jgi:hypothetical protein
MCESTEEGDPPSNVPSDDGAYINAEYDEEQ